MKRPPYRTEEDLLVLLAPGRRRRQPRVPAQPGPRRVRRAVEVQRLATRVLQKLGERDLIAEALEVAQQALPLPQSRDRPEIVEHDLSTNTVKFDLTAAGQERKAVLDLLAHRAASNVNDC